MKYTLQDVHNIGHFVSTYSIYENVESAIKNGCYVIAFQHPFKKNNLYLLPQEALLETQILIKRFPLLIFYNFFGNLCGSSRELAWDNNNTINTQTKSLINNIEQELSIMARLNGIIIMNAGCYRFLEDKEKAITAAITTIHKLHIKEDEYIAIENGNVFYDHIVCSLQELSNFKQRCDLKFIKVAINIIHLYVSGFFDFRDIKQIISFFKELIHLNINPSVIILNDSKVDFGGKQIDIVGLLDGTIWNKKNLKYFLKECNKRNYYIITRSVKDMNICKSLLNQ
jgi:hypothetical protein